MHLGPIGERLMQTKVPRVSTVVDDIVYYSKSDILNSCEGRRAKSKGCDGGEVVCV